MPTLLLIDQSILQPWISIERWQKVACAYLTFWSPMPAMDHDAIAPPKSFPWKVFAEFTRLRSLVQWRQNYNNLQKIRYVTQTMGGDFGGPVFDCSSVAFCPETSVSIGPGLAWPWWALPKLTLDWGNHWPSLSMGIHQSSVSVLVQDKKLGCFEPSEKIFSTATTT